MPYAPFRIRRPDLKCLMFHTASCIPVIKYVNSHVYTFHRRDLRKSQLTCHSPWQCGACVRSWSWLCFGIPSGWSPWQAGPWPGPPMTFIRSRWALCFALAGLARGTQAASVRRCKDRRHVLFTFVPAQTAKGGAPAKFRVTGLPQNTLMGTSELVT